MRKLFFCAAVLIAPLVHGQERIVSLVEAERAFARFATENNTRDAFLKFMDSNAVVFDKGAIQKARETWEAKKVGTGRLSWEPAFAVVSTAGDLGVTTGPWEFRKSAGDTVIARGEFTTIWKKNGAGEWKWLADIGIDHGMEATNFKTVKTIEHTHIERSSYDAARYLSLAEQQFITSYTTGGKEAWLNVADNDVYFINQGFLPVSGRQHIDAALVNMSGGLRFEPIGSGVSKDGDLGYVYGYATENGKKGNYLRVWKRVGRRWSLLLQTLTI